jgi:hypothetical protein
MGKATEKLVIEVDPEVKRIIEEAVVALRESGVKATKKSVVEGIVLWGMYEYVERTRS